MQVHPSFSITYSLRWDLNPRSGIQKLLYLQINSPFADVEDAWSLHDHCVQLVFQAALGNVLQAPVPVVVIVGAEELSTVRNVLPGAAIERHAHVVLAADPRRHFCLNNTSSQLQNLSNSSK